MSGIKTHNTFTGTKKNGKGFTIVELLIVIVVIAVLASITAVAFNGIQKRGRDASRKTDIATMSKALELFYIDNGYYPLIQNSGSTASYVNNEIVRSSDSSWERTGTATPPFFNSLYAALVPKYISKLPRDPINTPNVDVRMSTSAYSYMYFGNYNSNYCNSPDGQGYIIVYRNENGVTDDLQGTCSTNPVGPYPDGASTKRLMK